MERAHEVREITEPDVERDIGDRPGTFSEQACRMPQPRAHQVLVRCDTKNFCEEPQKVK
jgi:hypothetical protein